MALKEAHAQAVKAGSFPWELQSERAARVRSTDGGRNTEGNILLSADGMCVWSVAQWAPPDLVTFVQGASLDAELAMAAAECSFKLLVQRAVDAE